MSESTQNSIDLLSNCYPSVPESILNASRCELTDIKLEIEGELPEDLQGYVFIVAPVGSVNSGGLPYPNGDPLLNGDGIIYRLDLAQQGEVTIKTRLVKPPDYYADKATRPGTKYAKYRFRNHGITRFSLSLGFRNELNTAFLPMKFAGDSQERLLVTYDAGRPYEIDTETLEITNPVGANQEWRAEINQPQFPFKPILSTAHPAFDAYTSEVFTVNYGRSISNFLQTIPFFLELEQLPSEVDELIAAFTGFLSADLFKDVFGIFSQFSQNLFQASMGLIEEITGIEIEDFVYLIRWDGKSNLERWKLVLPDGSPIRIEQTMHQIGVSKDYLILMDTAFTTGTEQVLNNPFPENKQIERVLRELWERPALSDSHIYIVRRQDLVAGQRPACNRNEVEVVVKKLIIPLPAAHFLVDYDNPQGQITLHVSHIADWDVAEWIRQYDLSAYKPHNPIPDRLYSMETSEMDISRMGRYVIDGERAKVIKSKVIYASPYTWGTGLYAFRDRLPSGMPPGQLDNIYWTSFGLWKELMTKFMLELYRDFQYRAVPLTELLRLGEEGVPSYLFRLHTSDESMTIADFYQFPRGYIGSSPQFIPRRGSEGVSTDGYLICTVFTPNSNEFWIFDAQNLSEPKCKLSHPSLNFGFSLHTSWLANIGRRQAGYNIPVKQDYQELISQQSKSIEELFEQEVFPHFE